MNEGLSPRNHVNCYSDLALTMGELLHLCSPLFLHLENESPGPGCSS